ncbi:hypothetical protein BDR06DRAFT_967246 [Suillus hirtellus]|nr:hypothetical protein BDR06DRAFT_967246 [Suillus hirtellus]
MSICVVSGGGAGLMIAQAFADIGAKFYITSCRQASLKHTTKQWGSSLAHPKGKLIPTRSNIGLVQEIGKQEDRIDLLVNNAGISEAPYEYNVSKAAAIRLITLLAQEFRMVAGQVRTMARRKDYTDRPGRGEDITQAALMLACNQYAYGQILAIDGSPLILYAKNFNDAIFYLI